MAKIHEVAKAAGVSISTVSYALSGKRPVSEDTRPRIEAQRSNWTIARTPVPGCWPGTAFLEKRAPDFTKTLKSATAA